MLPPDPMTVQQKVRLEDVLALVWRLPEVERGKLRQLLEEERASAKESEATSPARRRLNELRGLGKELWSQVNTEQYLDAERDSWDKQW